MAACAVSSFRNGSRSNIESYWATGTFGEMDGFKRIWYSAHLCAMGEPTLVPNDGAVRVRFLWLRSFHPSIAVRIECSSSSTIVLSTQLSGKGGYEPGGVDRHTERTLSEYEWSSLQRAINEGGFWSLPSEETNVTGHDGAQWVLEVADHDRYHVVDRWSGGELEEMGRHILRLSHLDPEPIY
jgi:hypothetical protein